jgi:hypothetical protein
MRFDMRKDDMRLKEWTQFKRIDGSFGGAHCYIKGEYVVRMCMAAKINIDSHDLVMKVENVYGSALECGKGWIVLCVRSVV